MKSNESAPELYIPVFVSPEKLNPGTLTVPAMILNAPVIVSPDFNTLLLAEPVSAPTKVVLVTDDNPTNVVAVAPSDTLVDPIVILLLVKPAFGMPVKLVPVIVGVLVQVGIPEPVDCNN